LNVSLRNQVLTLRHFRDGVANCLFATSVAEEGLDIPDCNLVIRFDLYTTVIQYIQSRGRARKDNSKYIHMIEAGNKRQDALVKEVRRHENILKLFCSALPEDRLLTGNHANLDYFLAKERSTQRVYREPSTGAKLTYRTGLGVLANFVASLPHIPESMPHPVYIMTSQNKQFICEVILPENSPIRGALGRTAATKQVAKCSAAFETCLLLRNGKYLDEYLLSTFKKQARAMQNAALAITSKKQEQYDMRTKPAIWTADEIPTELYLNVLTFDDMTPLGRPAQPLGLLTRSPIPQLPSFPLFFDKERRSNVLCIPLQECLKVDSDTLGLINTFTLRIFADVFSKEYETNFQKMPYFLVPLRKENNVSDVGLKAPSEVIAWDILKIVDEVDEYKWDYDKADECLADRYVVDPFDGSRKFWSVKVTKDYKPLDPVPPNTAPRLGARKNNDNILEYSCSLWAASRARRTFRTDQPVLEAEYIPLRRNLLDDSNCIESKSPRKCYIVPEPLKISAVSSRSITFEISD
jgi:endoribonuclease Dicer